MEKISSIVPKSRRVSSVDLATALPARPGAPAFGRPMGESAVSIKDTQTTAQKAVAEFKHQSEVRKKSMSSPEIVENMASNFFLKRSIEAPAPALTPSPEVIEDEDNSDIELELKPAMETVKKEYVPPGTYLNVSA